MRCLLSALVAALVLAGCAPDTPAPTPIIINVTPAPSAASAGSTEPARPTSSAATEPTATPATAVPQGSAVVVEGNGSQRSTRFTLAAGDYVVAITGRGSDSHIVHVNIVPIDNDSSIENLVGEITPGQGEYSYDNNLDGVSSGIYYLDAVMPDGTWTVTFTPQ